MKKIVLLNNNKPVSFKTLLVVYGIFIVFAVSLTCILEHLPTELNRIKEVAIADLDFSDIWYKTRCPKKASDNQPQVLLINSGSLDPQTLRYDLSKLLDTLTLYQPRRIGIDIYFVDKKNADTLDTLYKSIKNSNAIVGIDHQYNSAFWPLYKDSAIYGYINLSGKSKESIREYYTGRFATPSNQDSFYASSFAMILAGKHAEKEEKFFFKYYSDETTYYDVADTNWVDTSERLFPAIEARDLLSKQSITDSALRSLIKDKIIIIGYLGNQLQNDPDNIRDKHRVPLNSDLVNRERTMFGAGIHANAVQYLLDYGINGVTDVGGEATQIIAFILLFGILYVLMLIDHLRSPWLKLAVEIPFLFFTVIGLIAIDIQLLGCNIHYNMSLFLIYLAVLIEYKSFAFELYEKCEHKKHNKHKK